MAIVINRQWLSPEDKEFLRTRLCINTTDDPPVTFRPFEVHDDEVRLPFAFYQELRTRMLATGQPPERWPEHPNDSKHTRLAAGGSFTGALRPYQSEVWLETQPILNRTRTILLSCHCGWGKTLFSAFIAMKTGVPTLILYHISPLGRSWPQTFAQFTTAKVCHINHDRFDPTAQIYIATVDSALSPKFPLTPERVGCLIIDEAHCFCSPKRIFSLLKFTPKYLLLLTATPERANGAGALLPLFHGSDQIVRISDKPFTVYKCATNIKAVMKAGLRGLDWKLVKDSMITRPALITLICDWVTANPHKKILVWVIQIDQLTAIAEELVRRGEDVGTLYGAQSSYEECRVLVAIDKKCGLGFDDATTCLNYGGRRLDMIILGWTIKDRGVVEQTCGRIRGSNGSIIDLVHPGGVFKKHYQNRAEWYLSRNGTIVDCTAPYQIP